MLTVKFWQAGKQRMQFLRRCFAILIQRIAQALADRLTYGVRVMVIQLNFSLNSVRHNLFQFNSTSIQYLQVKSSRVNSLRFIAWNGDLQVKIKSR